MYSSEYPTCVYLSRSKVEARQSCGRRAYFEYLYGGSGISVNPGPVYFDTGNAVHSGLAACLKMIQSGVTVPGPEHISYAISETLKDFDKRTRTLDTSALNPHLLTLELDYRDEQRDLSAAIVYAWIVEEWQPFADRFDVIAVELDTTFTNSALGVTLKWESKADAIVREKLPPYEHSVISWKTAADTKPWTRKRYTSDLQGYLECWFAQQHTGLTIDYNQVIYLCKGKKLRTGAEGQELPWNTPLEQVTRFYTDSFLLYPLTKPESHSSPFFNELDNVMENVIWTPSYRRPGNQTDSQYKGWNRADRLRLNDLDETGFPVLFRWIDALKANRVFPTYDFQGGAPAPLNRVIVWENQSPRYDALTLQLLKEISFHEAIASPANPLHLPVDVQYPRNLKVCNDAPPDALGRFTCAYSDLCKGAAMVEPGSEGLWFASDDPPAGFVWRTPHHEAELSALGLAAPGKF